MNIPSACDVAVIGGGPAGSLAATYLGRKGYSVVLLEKQQHPRYAVGESLLPDFWRYAVEAGVAEALEAENFVRKAGGIVEWQGSIRGMSFADFGYRRPALHVERDRFDQILLTHARASGVQVFEQVAVVEVDLGDPEASVVRYRHLGASTAAMAPGTAQEGRLACRYVVDASGQGGVISRQLGLRVVDEAFRFMSVWGYFDGTDYLAADGGIHPASDLRTVPPVTYVTALPRGDGWAWLWFIILRETTSVGVVVPPAWVQEARRGTADWETWFRRQCESAPLVARLLEPARFRGPVRLVRDYSSRSRRLAGPGFFLAGDAAGFVDPIFSVGLAFAAYTAYAAASSVDRCLRAPARRPEAQALFESQVQARLALSRSLALPYYQTPAADLEPARSAIRFASEQARELMCAAALLTARAPNFMTLVDDPGSRDRAQARIRHLDVRT